MNMLRLYSSICPYCGACFSTTLESSQLDVEHIRNCHSEKCQKNPFKILIDWLQTKAKTGLMVKIQGRSDGGKFLAVGIVDNASDKEVVLSCVKYDPADGDYMIIKHTFQLKEISSITELEEKRDK